MASTPPRSSSTPAHTDLPTNENAIDANAVIEEPVVSSEANLHKNMSNTLEQLQDQIKSNNTSEECVVSTGGGLARQMSDTLEQTPDTIKPDTLMSIEESLAKMSDTLGQVLDVLKGSTIAEELGKDDNSKFWATYKKVSNEYDDDFLGRANDDMGIILTFAGLFSAVNSTFIIGTQPNPGDTTNALLVQFIQITVNGPNSVPDINTLSSSTGFSSSTVWMQTLAYASLAFSLLAAFGAVLGKQWLHSYMVTQGRGTLEERGKERQMKLDGVEYFRLQTVLQSFLVLLQVSLLLFGLSLSANMWVKQTTIASVIISTTGFGLLFYACTILVSALRLDSPFQTPGSELFVTICKKILPKKFVFTPNIFVKSSAIRWILETSTNPEIINTAAAIVPSVQWRPNLDASASYGRLLDNFLRCCDKPELCLNYQKAMAHLCIQPVKIDSRLLKNSFWNSGQFEQNRIRLICDAFTAGRAAYDQLRKPVAVHLHDYLRNPGFTFTASQLKHLASVRTALRAMLVHGLSYQLSRPDDEDLIWHNNLRWDHSNGWDHRKGRQHSSDASCRHELALSRRSSSHRLPSDCSNGSEPSLDHSNGSEPSLNHSNGSEPSLDHSNGSEPSLNRSNWSEPSMDHSNRSEPSLDHGNGGEHSCAEFDWLIDYLASMEKAQCRTDDETQGDALLVLSTMQGLGSPTKQRSYIRSLIHCMDPARPRRVRHTALRAVFEAREELASMTSASVRDAQLLNELSHALLTAIHSNNDRTTRYTGPGGSFYIDRDKCYIYLIYALIKKDEWCQRLAHDDLLDRCIPLLGRLSRPDVVDRSGAVFYKYNLDTEAEFHFLVIFGRIKSSDKGLLFSPDESLRWLLLITRTWENTPFGIEDDDYINGIPAVVTAARLTLTALDDGVPREWLADVAANVHLALVRLQERQARLVNKGIAQAAIDAALSSMQGLHTEFSLMVEQWNTSGKNRNRGSLGDRYIQDRRNRDTIRHDRYGSTFFYITRASHHHGVSDEAPSSGKTSVTNLGPVHQTFSNLW